jgi:NADP-reducing hydrogenase subunit HndD
MKKTTKKTVAKKTTKKVVAKAKTTKTKVTKAASKKVDSKVQNKMLNIKINGVDYKAPAGSTILEACRLANIEIPTLCFLKDLNEIAACRVCMVEVKNARSLVAACVYPINEGIEIFTNTKRVVESRKKTIELILSNHRMDCLSCVRSGNCELLTLARVNGVDDTKYQGAKTPTKIDDSAVHLIRDNSKCVLCRRCIAACSKLQSVGVIGTNNRGFKTVVGSQFDIPLGETSCVHCGQCINVCPVGALYEKSDADKILDAIRDPEKFVVVQTAPAVRATIAEEFGAPIGTNGEGKMVAALRRIGFNKVFDTDFAADLTIMEEGTELIERLKAKKATLPMITSCSPGWIKFIENYYPDLLDHLSTCKSPQQMFGATLKTYYANKNKIDPKKIVSVSVMPCTAKKFEIHKEDQSAAGKGMPDLDYTMTTRELARMIKKLGIDWNSLPEEEFDSPMGTDTGAAVIFGTSGGVMEAALRTAAEVLAGKKMKSLEYKEVRGMKGIKEASYTIKKGLTVKVAVASGTANARVLLDAIREGKADYHFIEIMCCPGGCINGGGQPQVPARIRNTTDFRQKRAEVLYKQDKSMKLRKSHENPDIQRLYKEWFGKPGSEKAHHALHTSYVKRSWT